MFSYSQNVRRFCQRPTSRQSERIGRLYRKLSVSLDRVRNALESEEDLRRRVCLTVLDEDLSSLLEECEASILCGEEMPSCTIGSLESRSDTVIEEMDLVLSRNDDSLPH
jgi:hypothetical protein